MPTFLTDAKIDQTTMDLVVVGGDIVLVQGYDEICQAVFIAARVLKGEWFLDPSLGWISLPFGKAVTPTQLAALAVKNILTVQGVLANPSPTAVVTVLSPRVSSLFYTAQTDWGLPTSGTVVGP